MSHGSSMLASRSQPVDGAMRVAVIAALAAASMLFASLISAYVVRRSFADWRPVPALWPFALLGLAFAASAGIECAFRGRTPLHRRLGWQAFGGGSVLYALGALAALVAMSASDGGLTPPHRAFVFLLLAVHLVHALLGAAFAVSALRVFSRDVSDERISLARLVTHFLTALLCAIVFLLFVIQ